MTNKPRVLSDGDLLDACCKQADMGSRFVDTSLAAERRQVTEYYLGERPLPLKEGGSKFVSQDVYLSVETMKAEIVETFGAGSAIVAFSPQGADDVDQAKHATAYCEMAVHRQNDGLGIFCDVVHDGLTARASVAKVYWDKAETAEEYELVDVSPEEAAAVIQDPEVHLTSKPVVKEGPEGQPLVSVSFERVTDVSQVSIEPMPPEEFIITGRTKRLDKARYLAHRYRDTLGSLVEAGYPEDLVYSIAGSDDDFAFEAERMQREADTTTGFSDEDATDAAGRMVTIFESYIRIDVEGTGRQQLWKVVHVGDTLLEKQKVADHPFVSYVPQPIPHTFFGNNFAKRTIPHANTKTTLTRAIIEQAVDATNPRWQVARGGVPNPRELLDNRKGGVVNVRSVTDSVAPLPQAPINPFVLQTIGMVDSGREDATGISRLSQGLDKKALSHQNSAGMVDKLTENSQTRTKLIARHFAHQFVAQLYLKVYKLAIENETKERMLEIGGQYVPVSPSRWRSRRDVRIDMTLGYGERDERVAELAELHQVFEKSPKLGRMYGEKQAFALWRDALDIKGIKNIGDYLADPSTLGEPTPDPKIAAEIKKLETDAQVAERQQTLREAQVTAELQRNGAEHEVKVIAMQEDIILKRAEQSRKDAETANRIDIGLAELELAVEAQATASDDNTKLTAIASPNS